MMKRSFSKSRGFTLLEILVAFSIFTVSLGVLFQIFSKGTRAAMLGDEYSQAIIIAQSRLASFGIEVSLMMVNTVARKIKPIAGQPLFAPMIRVTIWKQISAFQDAK